MGTEKYQTYDDLFVYYYLKMLCQTLEKKKNMFNSCC